MRVQGQIVNQASRLSSIHTIAAQILCAAFLYLAGCTTPPRIEPTKLPPADGVTQHHVILFAATDWGETGRKVDDPTSRNAVWLQTTRLATSARAFRNPGSIQILYQEGQHPQDEPAAGLPLQSATLEDLQSALAKAASQMDADDHLTIHLSVHGLRTGNLETDTDEILSPKEIARALAPIPASQRFLILDACFAGNFLRNPQIQGPRIGTSPTDKYGWIERDFSFAEYFFDSCQSPSDPTNRRRAFAESADRFKKAGERRLPFIKNDYGDKGLKEEVVNDLSFEAIYIPAE